MDGKRASIFDDEAADLDLSGFKPTTPKKSVAQEQVRAISEGANFRSREPKPAIPATQPPAREPRRHRTGRNVQFNVKVRTDTIARFYSITDAQGWVLGETFERAVTALEQSLTQKPQTR